MSLPAIMVVDIQHNNKEVDLNDLMQTALGSLIYECERLMVKIKDAYADVED